MHPEFGKTLIILGALFVVVGAFMLWGGDRIPLGRLPGDINFERNGVRFSFPIVTCVVVSIILSVLFSIFRR